MSYFCADVPLRNYSHSLLIIISLLWWWCCVVHQVAVLSHIASNWLNCQEEAKRLGTAHPSIVPYQVGAYKIVFSNVQWRQSKFILGERAKKRHFVWSQIDPVTHVGQWGLKCRKSRLNAISGGPGSFGSRQRAPSHQQGSLGSAVSSPSRVRGGVPAADAFWPRKVQKTANFEGAKRYSCPGIFL